MKIETKVKMIDPGCYDKTELKKKIIRGEINLNQIVLPDRLTLKKEIQKATGHKMEDLL